MQMSTTHSSFHQYCISHKTVSLFIKQLLHPAMMSTVSAPWHNFNLCPSSQQILATPLGLLAGSRHPVSEREGRWLEIFLLAYFRSWHPVTSGLLKTEIYSPRLWKLGHSQVVGLRLECSPIAQFNFITLVGTNVACGSKPYLWLWITE